MHVRSKANNNVRSRPLSAETRVHLVPVTIWLRSAFISVELSAVRGIVPEGPSSIHVVCPSGRQRVDPEEHRGQVSEVLSRDPTSRKSILLFGPLVFGAPLGLSAPTTPRVCFPPVTTATAHYGTIVRFSTKWGGIFVRTVTSEQ